MMMSARLRRRSGIGSQNLDSLLDTMANVIGILIVVMAVTQLSVSDAMKRIRVYESPEAMAVSEERLQAQTRLASVQVTHLTEKLELARLQEHARRLKSNPRAAAARNPLEIETQVASAKAERRRLEATLATQRDELGVLRIQLDDLDAQPALQHIELRLPDPRPAPFNAEQVIVLARYGRVLFPHMDRLERDLISVLRVVGFGASDYFATHDVGSRDLRWQVLDTPIGRQARLQWRHSEVGETPEQLRSPESSLARALESYDPKEHFVRFFVWADSFEAYLAARAVVEDQGFAVGWEAYEIGRGLDFSTRQQSRKPTPVD